MSLSSKIICSGCRRIDRTTACSTRCTGRFYEAARHFLDTLDRDITEARQPASWSQWLPLATGLARISIQWRPPRHFHTRRVALLVSHAARSAFLFATRSNTPLAPPRLVARSCHAPLIWVSSVSVILLRRRSPRDRCFRVPRGGPTGTTPF